MLEIVEDLAPGVVIAGKYRLDRVLGQGGMGVVWAAREIASDDRVALKFLLRGSDADERERARFVREGRAAMAVTHPHVAKVRAVLETSVGTPFIVMDLLEGESLRALLRRRGPLTVAECARLFVPVVDAVEAAHAARIVHRDLKPENVFLVGGTDVRVLDFGIAKTIQRGDETAEASLTSTGAVLGTPVYMAPEQVFGDDDVDGRADVWALGIVLYECLAGRRPTDAEGFGQVLKRITTAPLEPLGTARADLPRRLTRLVDRMLQREREARPSLVEVRSVLEAVARDDDAPPSQQASPPSEIETVAPGASTTAAVANASSPLPPVRRRLGYGVVLVSLVAVAGVAFVAGRQRTAPSTSTTSPVVTAPPPSAPAIASSAPAAAQSGDLDFRARLDGGAKPVDVVAPLTAQIGQQLERRDGRACMRDLDLLDALDLSMPRSRDPKSGWAHMRAQCTMLAGDCEGGKRLYGRAYDAMPIKGMTAESRQQALDLVVSQFCEGDNLAPHDALLRARARLADAVSGVRKATRADCLSWHETEKRLSARERETPGEADVRRRLIRTNVTLCLARAGECRHARDVFRTLWLPSDGDEAALRALLDEVVPPATCPTDR